MSRTRCLAYLVISLALLITAFQPASAQGKKPVSPVEPQPLPRSDTSAPALTGQVYALYELGDDPSLGKFIAETIPTVIEPGTWNQDGAGGKRVLTYYAPGKVLVVYHTPAVHAQVDAFLKALKRSLPQAPERTLTKPAKVDPAVVPVQYPAPAVLKAIDTGVGAALGYPVPAQAQQPKHLFHFIIRYEGAGIIDDNVASLFKSMYSNKQSESSACSGVGLAGTSGPTSAPTTGTSNMLPPANLGPCGVPGSNVGQPRPLDPAPAPSNKSPYPVGALVAP